MDDDLFVCYRLGSFGRLEVTDYATKWFATQEDATPAEAALKAKAFLGESASAADLRSNPLMLSLMCILYRGSGSLPADRAGIYARCAELLLHKWDEQRDLYRKLGADHLIQPTLRHLAWWLFTREAATTAATERELEAKAAEFLRDRGYETAEEARTAAREFVEFCRGRTWVFSDAGTTADGEKLYSFTHRTFMEYFAAWNLAATCDAPEDLARALAPRVGSQGWGVVGELAVKLKSDATDRGADRIYTALLDPALTTASGGPPLQFLAECLASARPSPTSVRALTRAAIDYFERSDPSESLSGLAPLRLLFAQKRGYEQPIADEIRSWAAAKAGCPAPLFAEFSCGFLGERMFAVVARNGD